MTLRSALAEGGRLDDYQFSMQINNLDNESAPDEPSVLDFRHLNGRLKEPDYLTLFHTSINSIAIFSDSLVFDDSRVSRHLRL